MKSKDLGEATILVFETGDEVISQLTAFATDHPITAAHFTAIGAFRDAGLGYFDWQTKKYLRNQVDEQVEVVSLTGDIAIDGDHPSVHAHAVIAKRDGSTMGGHVLEAHVRPTLELVLEKSPALLQKRFDEESGLALISV
jgi:uncharacterized protein